eukprot:464717-Rhodomonas_salina.1
MPNGFKFECKNNLNPPKRSPVGIPTTSTTTSSSTTTSTSLDTTTTLGNSYGAQRSQIQQLKVNCRPRQDWCRQKLPGLGTGTVQWYNPQLAAARDWVPGTKRRYSSFCMISSLMALICTCPGRACEAKGLPLKTLIDDESGLALNFESNLSKGTW